MSSIISLKDRHTDATQNLILSTAVDILENDGVPDLTIRAVAKRAGMSERTIFRYFPTRDAFLDAVASAAVDAMETPPPPASVKDLLEYPAVLYRCFEARSSLVIAGLHTELITRVRRESAGERWHGVERLVDEIAAERPKKQRSVASANINYYLSATTWNYYRSNFGLSLADTIACAKAAIRLIVEDISS